ncbi:MAG TPA: arginine-ornithine antiporter, partial [Lactobacillus sp.]|nr:arginine-ornithine antiporter [Lactobacillus sp.]
SIGLLISILGAWLSWTMLPAETLGMMAEQGLLPKRFAKKNKHGVPTLALMTTACMVQGFMIILIFAEKAYEFAYSLCTASIVVCYIIVAAYQIKYSWQNRSTKGNWLQMWIGIAALTFQLVGITLSGLQYLFICLVVYVPGIILYALTLKTNTGHYLNRLEWSASILIFSGAVITVAMMLMGRLSL